MSMNSNARLNSDHNEPMKKLSIKDRLGPIRAPSGGRSTNLRKSPSRKDKWLVKHKHDYGSLIKNFRDSTKIISKLYFNFLGIHKMINTIKDTKIPKFHQNLLRLQPSEVEMVQSQKKAQKMGMIFPISFDYITRDNSTETFNETQMFKFFH